MNMLRSTRGLLLLAIVLTLGAVGIAYYTQRRTVASEAPQAPKSLPLNTDAAATGWVYRKDQATRGVFEVHATRFRRINDPDIVEIEGVEVQIFKKDAPKFDRIRSAKALFDEAKETLYSDGPVEITLGVPIEGLPKTKLMTIRSSGMMYESRTGKAYTKRPADFDFELGEGKCVGASYDPNAAQLVMDSQVELHWHGRDVDAKPMKIEAGELVYKERDSYVLLRPWSKLTRETGVLEGGEAVITLEHGQIQKVEAKQARGNDRQPGRNLEYSADRFQMMLTPKGEIEKLTGEPNARLVSSTETARTTITGRRVDLTFDTSSGASEMREALTTGNTVLEAVPVKRPGVPPADTRILRSDRVLLKMRPGGREMESAETQSPGKLEFLPNRPGQRHRTLDADRMFVTYGAENVIQQFRARNAATRTDPEPPAKGKKPADPTLTWSKDLKADFEPKTGELARMEQWNDFRYQQGDRKATAHRAVLEEAKNLITLDREARIWDSTGTTSADKILLDQKSGDLFADGNVVSTRMPDQKGSSSAMLSNDQPLQATAARMKTAEKNQKIHYEGQAVAWQGANRIWADVIDIDRAKHVLTAHGRVRTQFIEQQKQSGQPATDGAAAQTAAVDTGNRPPVFVNVTASDLVYTDTDRIAHYTGGVHMVRPGMDVKGSEMRAFLNDSKAESSLDHAIADGSVVIVRQEPDRTLTGTGEHAEYYTADQRIVMSGGEPVLVDSARGVTKGRQLTYWANNDKLLVDGTAKQPVTTLVHRRR